MDLWGDVASCCVLGCLPGFGAELENVLEATGYSGKASGRSFGRVKPAFRKVFVNPRKSYEFPENRRNS